MNARYFIPNPQATQVTQDTSITNDLISKNKTRTDGLPTVNTVPGLYRYNYQKDVEHHPSVIIKLNRTPLKLISLESLNQPI